MVATPLHSSIREHCHQCQSPITFNHFKILGKSNNKFELRILESMFIYKLKPNLNLTQTAAPLHIINK